MQSFDFHQSFSKSQDITNGDINLNGQKGEKNFLKSMWWIILVIIGVIAIIILIILIILKRKKPQNEIEKESSSTIEVNQYQNSMNSLNFDNPLYINEQRIEDPFEKEYEEDL